MKIINFFDSDNQSYWLEKIKQSDWSAGQLLYKFISEGIFFDSVGEGSKVLLLTDGNELISYCTYARYDDIQPTELSPWVGFVYTFPKYRGHHYMQFLFDEVEKLAKQEKVSQVYISTNHTGLYEKYDCTYLCELNDMEGNPSRVYVKKITD